MITVLPGATLSIKEKFLDDFGAPLIPDQTPYVCLLDTDGERITLSYATNDVVAGTWIADVIVPQFDNKDQIELTVQWEFEADGTRYRSKENIIVEPSIEERETEAVVLFGDQKYVINVPFKTDAAASPEVSYDFYDENTLLYSVTSSDASVLYAQNNYTTNVALPLTVSGASLTPRLALVKYTKSGKLIPEVISYKVWVVTPSILNAVSQLEGFVNKSRISNVIPELRFATSDLLLALSKGLYMFNSMQPVISSFNGTNMQGALLESWIICSAIALLNMQYMAEGSLAFDFSGQSVSLNIDRTQYIDAMLGRLDSMVENQVKPLKHLLGKYGITTGDGSIGNKNIGAGRFGVTTLSLAPTTRFYGGNMYSATGFKKYW